jgi:acetyl esterase/lipase
VLGTRRLLRERPWPFAFVLRRAYALGGARTAARLAPHVPAGVDAVFDERYGGSPDARLDVYFPAGAEGALPTVVWVHGGGFVGGRKEELEGWFRILAAHGFTVAGVEYSRAPRAVHPTPARQVAAALAYLQANAGRLRVDPKRFVLAGDSGGAHIAAQAANAVTSPAYAAALGIPAGLDPLQLRAVVLCCGPYDLALEGARTARGRRFTHATLTRYAGTSRYHHDPEFELASVGRHLTATFPPAFVTAGESDPLAPQSEALAAVLGERGVEVDALFFPPDHDPPAGHEYQFELDTDAGRLALDRIVAFLRRHTEVPAEVSSPP